MCGIWVARARCVWAYAGGRGTRGLEPLADQLIAIDEERRANLTTLQEAQSRRNSASKEIGKAKGAKDEETASKLMAEVAALKDTIAKGEETGRALDEKLRDVLAGIPNLPLEEVPEGPDESVECRLWNLVGFLLHALGG